MNDGTQWGSYTQYFLLLTNITHFSTKKNVIMIVFEIFWTQSKKCVDKNRSWLYLYVKNYFLSRISIHSFLSSPYLSFDVWFDGNCCRFVDSPCKLFFRLLDWKNLLNNAIFYFNLSHSLSLSFASAIGRWGYSFFFGCCFSNLIFKWQYTKISQIFPFNCTAAIHLFL